jgi:hypothetical protein
MPKAFLDAIREGAKVRTKTLPGGRYIRIAFTKSGRSIAGEVKTKQHK